ncbi:MAG: hypothetical protein PHS66_04855 [Candidatus Omnitrophica bacterium]|nr:hypothetical protein [Candidatus Omnitrophota bacterium]
MLYSKVRGFFKFLNKYIRMAINILIRILLFVVYLVLLLPFAGVIKVSADYLGVKRHLPSWIPLKNTGDIKEMLSHQ